MSEMFFSGLAQNFVVQLVFEGIKYFATRSKGDYFVKIFKDCLKTSAEKLKPNFPVEAALLRKPELCQKLAASLQSPEIDRSAFLKVLENAGLSKKIAQRVYDEIHETFKILIEEEAVKHPEIFRAIIIDIAEKIEVSMSQLVEDLQPLKKEMPTIVSLVSSVKIQLDRIESKIDQFIERMHANLVLYPSRYRWIASTKEIWIKNQDGDASIRRKLIGKNSSGEPMKRLVWEVLHNGSYRVPVLRVNGIIVRPEIETSKLTPGFKRNDVAKHRLPYITRIRVNLEPFQILPESTFSLEIEGEGEKTFPNMYVEEFTNIHVKTPSDEMEFVLHTSKESVFVHQSIGYEVRDEMGNPDSYEMNRLRSYTPELLEDNSSLKWRIPSPLIGRNYTLKFGVQKRESLQCARSKD